MDTNGHKRDGVKNKVLQPEYGVITGHSILLQMMFWVSTYTLEISPLKQDKEPIYWGLGTEIPWFKMSQ